MVDFEELCSILEQYWVADDAQNELRDAFSVFDREGNGFLTVEQFKSMLSSLGEKLTEDEIKEIMKDCTVNGDGTINYDGRSMNLNNTIKFIFYYLYF